MVGTRRFAGAIASFVAGVLACLVLASGFALAKGSPPPAGGTATEVQLDLSGGGGTTQLNSGVYCYDMWVVYASTPPCPGGVPPFDDPIPGIEKAVSTLVDPGDYPATAAYSVRYVLFQGLGSDPSEGTLCLRLLNVTTNTPVPNSETCHTGGRGATVQVASGVILSPGTNAYAVQAFLESGQGSAGRVVLIVD